jgi:hypothetical protein
MPSQWLFSALAEAELPVVRVETRHMQAVLKAQINKTAVIRIWPVLGQMVTILETESNAVPRRPRRYCCISRNAGSRATALQPVHPKARRASLAHSSIAGWASVPPSRAVFNPQPIGDSAT